MPPLVIHGLPPELHDACDKAIDGRRFLIVVARQDAGGNQVDCRVFLSNLFPAGAIVPALKMAADQCMQQHQPKSLVIYPGGAVPDDIRGG